MKLYYAPGTCALACWIAMEWAGADYEVEKIKSYNDPEFLKVNPMGMVPALHIGGPRAMTQADAILQYIAQGHPEADLGTNPGLENQFEFNETMAFLTGDFHPAFWPMFVPGRYTTLKTKEAIEAAKEASYPRIDKVMQHLDKLLEGTDHVYQNKRSVADAYAFVMARWSLHTPKSYKEYPNLARFMDLMKEDPAVQKVLEESK